MIFHPHSLLLVEMHKQHNDYTLHILLPLPRTPHHPPPPYAKTQDNILERAARLLLGTTFYILCFPLMKQESGT